MKSTRHILGFLLLCFFFLMACGVKSKEHVFDLLPVKYKKEDKRISLIDFDGNLIADEAFSSSSEILPINDVITEITIEGKTKYWTVENKIVKPLIDREYAGGTPFYENVAVVRDEQGQLSLIDKKGEKLIPNLSKVKDYEVLRVGVMSDGLIRFKTDNEKWGYLNNKGEIVIKPIYTQCENFVNDMARVITDNNQLQVINKKGEVVYKGETETFYLPVSNSNIAFGKKGADNKIFYGLSDLKGEKIIKNNKYTGISLVSANMIAVQNEEKEWGVINTKQEVIGDLRFKFENEPIISKAGFVTAQIDKKAKLYNSKGELIKSFDEYENLIPIVGKRFMAIKPNDKFEILNEEGNEISKDAYILAHNHNFFNVAGAAYAYSFYESPEIVMNNFTIESKYFEFDQVFQNGFNYITSKDLLGVNSNSNIQQVIAKFPNAPYISTENFASAIDNYYFEFYVGSTKRPSDINSKKNYNNTRSIEQSDSYEGEGFTPKAEGYYDNIEQPTYTDNYPFLSEYNNEYTTHKNTGGIVFTYTFTFDQGLKTPIMGQDPIFTDQTTIVDFALNLSARLRQINIKYDLGKIDKTIFKNKLQQKLLAAGWNTSNNNLFYNNNSVCKIYLGNENLSFYFN